jgi:integrase
MGLPMKITERSIQTLELETGQNDRIFFDDHIIGLGLRVRRVRKWNGQLSNKEPLRSWIFQYRIGGRTRRIVIGPASGLKVQKVKEIAGDLAAKVRLGGDPATEKRIKVERAAHTLGALIQKYLTQHRSQLRPGSYRHIALHLETHAAPLHGLPVDAIDRKAIAERLNSIAGESGAVSANRVRSSMSAMFGWAMKEGLVTANPIIGTNKRAEKSRDRVLNDAELGKVWRALAADDYGTIVKLLILTGQRLGEIAALRWSEINFDRGVISLSGDRTKNGRPHEIPMSPTVRSLLKVRPSNGRELVFGEGAGPYSGFSHRKVPLDKSINIPPWTHHDLRRSVATGMAENGVQPHIIEAVLNHVSGHKGGIAGIYNRATYSAEKVQALMLWDKHINRITGGGR